MMFLWLQLVPMPNISLLLCWIVLLRSDLLTLLVFGFQNFLNEFYFVSCCFYCHFSTSKCMLSMHTYFTICWQSGKWELKHYFYIVDLSEAWVEIN